MWARSTKKCLLFKVNSCDGPLVQLIIVVGVFILIPDVIIVIILIFLFNLSMEIFQKKNQEGLPISIHTAFQVDPGSKKRSIPNSKGINFFCFRFPKTLMLKSLSGGILRKYHFCHFKKAHF